MSPYSKDRLPGHEQRRRELLAILDTQGPSRSRALAPGIAAGAVLAVCAAGILVAQPWRGPQDLAPAGPVAGQDPTQGVPREAAKPGDPVPWDVATRTLASCLERGRRAAVPPPPPTGFDTGRPTISPPTAGAPETSGPPSAGHGLPPGTLPYSVDVRMPESTPEDPSGGHGLPPGSTPTPLHWPTFGVTVGTAGGAGGSIEPPVATRRPSGTATAPDGRVWKVGEPDTAFKPYFTAWEEDGSGVLRPFVLGKAGKPDLVVCHGELTPPELPAPTAAGGILAGEFEVRQGRTWTPPTAEPLRIGLMSSMTWWGRTTGAVARVVVELPDGSTVGAVVRNGVWLAGVPGNDVVPARIRAYDAAGTLLYERGADHESLRCANAPMTKACGSRTHWG
ncbi:hypothetical protein [Embleya sp. NPDC005575]|uniref:hypothetical protein n=1 Tax=Embleya sp. NPDC005575 TaxID=3156892 RepID=UPI0033A6A02C